MSDIRICDECEKIKTLDKKNFVQSPITGKFSDTCNICTKAKRDEYNKDRYQRDYLSLRRCPNGWDKTTRSQCNPYRTPKPNEEKIKNIIRRVFAKHNMVTPWKKEEIKFNMA